MIFLRDCEKECALWNGCKRMHPNDDGGFWCKGCRLYRVPDDEPKKIVKTCIDCGKEYVCSAKAFKRLRCDDCRYKKLLEDNKARKEARKKLQVEKPPEQRKERTPRKANGTNCTRKKSCKYGKNMGGIEICDYLGITGTRRPCSVSGCTAYKRG